MKKEDHFLQSQQQLQPSLQPHGRIKLVSYLNGNLSYWRDPTYLMSKLSLNIIGGLFIGFFFKSKDTIQGTRNKLFVRLFFDISIASLLISTL
jgi:ABC-type multidrug transport system permease subunit